MKNSKPSGWYKQLVRRPVKYVEGYYSFEKVCSTIADIYYSTSPEKAYRYHLTYPKKTEYITIFVHSSVAQEKIPCYWIEKELLNALNNSSINIKFEELHWAVKTGLVMIPKNTLLSPEGHHVRYIAWHLFHDGAIYYSAFDGDNFYCRKRTIAPGSVYCSTETSSEEEVINFNDYLESILFKLMFLMECRPEIIEKEQVLKRNHSGFGNTVQPDYYEPLWIGKSYRYQSLSENKNRIEKKGIKPHLRRGFMKMQHYGKNRSQRKKIWIEPILVNM
jgi:hypothetical protein